MDETGMLDYFYGNEAEQFEFLQVPMILVKDPIYHQGKTALNFSMPLLWKNAHRIRSWASQRSIPCLIMPA